MRGEARQRGLQSLSRRTRASSVFVVLVGAVGCLELRESATHSAGPSDESCSGCHGDPTRDEPALLRLAPPNDVKGNRALEYPGVGAHALHLMPRAGYAAVTCDQCHMVPTEVRQPGHIDSSPPAEVNFDALTQLPGARDPRYDRSARTCQDTYCHGSTSGTWTHPRSSERACGSCHGLPPAWPHPQSDACSTCHGEVIAADGSWVAPHLHVNQRVEVLETTCTTCHGSGLNAAPPQALNGSTRADDPKVGAHQAHLLSTLGRSLECSECHPVPSTLSEPGHLNGSVDVVLSGVAQQANGSPQWEAEAQSCAQTWCHGPGDINRVSPRWSQAGPLGCSDCHGMPPPAPHPQVQNCNLCHAPVAGAESGELAHHVDGMIDVSVSNDCASCHGSADNSAPPRDTRGNTDPSLLSVGAHQAHLVGRGLARAMECSECHVVPEHVNSRGHIDDEVEDPAEVQFSGVATAFSAQPRYESGTCAQTFCHGDSFIAGGSGGLNIIPVWNVTDGTQIECTSCHGMPPPAPHPQENVADCGQCHRNMLDGTFTHPERHVDGIVTFFLNRGDQLE